MNLTKDSISSSETTFDKVTRLAGGIDHYCRQHAAWLAAAWGIGVAAFAVRFLAAWLSVWKLRRSPSDTVPHGLTETLHRLMKTLEMSTSIRLSVTERVDSPAVVGCIRPLILLPAHVITGLDTDDLTHILAHELAHIRRHDYAVNLAQCVIEMLFFHHPAVWWLSHQVREEREHCCDEIAIAACGDRFAYARSLATLDDMRPEPRPLVLALGTRGGRLMNRIRRLLGVPTPSIGGSGAIVLAGMALVVVIALAMGVNDATAQTEEKPGEAKTEEAAQLLAAELDDLIVLEAQQQLVQAEQARAEAQRAEQLARVAADLDKATAQLALDEQKFKLAELELELQEASVLEAFANDEAAIVEKMVQAGQMSQAEFVERKKHQAAARLAKQKAELALHALKAGQNPDSTLAHELELENAVAEAGIAKEALTAIEHQVQGGQASALELAKARREAIKAKFQVDRLRLKQQHLNQQGDEPLAENTETKAAKISDLKEYLSRVAEKVKAADAEQPTLRVYKLKHAPARVALELINRTIGSEKGSPLQAEADERSNIIIVKGTEPIHNEVAQLLAKLDGGPEHPDWENLKLFFEKKKGSDDWDAMVKNRLGGDAEIDRHTLIRRLSLDLRGTLPQPEEVKAFVNDTEPDAVRRLITRLLEGSGEGVPGEKVESYKSLKLQKTPKVPQLKLQPSGDADADAAANRKIAKAQADIEIQLLELDLRRAENDLAVVQKKWSHMVELNERAPRTVAGSEVDVAKIEVANCEIAVRRAKLKLEAAKLKQAPPAGETNPVEGVRKQH